MLFYSVFKEIDFATSLNGLAPVKDSGLAKAFTNSLNTWREFFT